MTMRGMLFFSAALLLPANVATLRAQQPTAPPVAAIAPVTATPRTAIVPSTPTVAQTPPAAQTPQVSPAPPASPEAEDFAFAFADPPGEVSFFFNQSGSYLGVQPEEINKENMSRYGLQREPRGVGVAQVIKDSPAERAGVRANDVILRFDGETVTSVRKLNRLIGETAPDHTARMTISRGGAEQEISVTLGARKNFTQNFEGMLAPRAEALRGQSDAMRRQGENLRRQSEKFKQQGEEMRRQGDNARRQMDEWRSKNPELFKGGRGFAFNFGGRRIGVTTTALTDQLGNFFGVPGNRGLLITRVGENTPAAKAGLKAGDIITAVNGKTVGEAGEMTRAINDQNEGDVTLIFYRDKKERSVTLTPEKNPSPTFELSPGALVIPPIAISVPNVKIATPAISIAPRVRVVPKVKIKPPII
ncbi:MAG TPA: PDZ domain-containing protein [Pyrinomonadaceae bacterium]|nr:PDZ domain-containing protein [Pyrinomonadaceae bacterium]